MDISTDLANEGGVTIAVKIIILNLEILAKRNQDIVALLEGFLIVDASLKVQRRRLAKSSHRMLQHTTNLLTMCKARTTGR